MSVQNGDIPKIMSHSSDPVADQTPRDYLKIISQIQSCSLLSSSSVPTPFFALPPFLSAGPPYFSHRTLRSSLAPPFFSTTSPRSHSFSVSRRPMRCSSSKFLFSSSLAVCSRACSRCFFLTRKRAEAAVLRRRLSSSAAARASGESSTGAVGLWAGGEERGCFWPG